MNIETSKSPITFRRINRRVIRLAVVHALLFAAAYFLAWFTRNDFTMQESWLKIYFSTVVVVTPFSEPRSTPPPRS